MSKSVAVRSHDGQSRWEVNRGTVLAELIHRASKRLDTDANTDNITSLVLGYSNRLIAALLTLYSAGSGDDEKMNTAVRIVHQNLEATCNQVEGIVLSK